MRVLVGCESSGVVREAFRRRGHHAVSCDLLPADDGSAAHYQEDIFQVLHVARWDLLIVHPPCTYLSVSGLHWNHRRPERAAQTESALHFVQRLLELPRVYPRLRLCLENPRGCISTRIRRPNQSIQPHQFGHDASKLTDLWLDGLEPLRIDPAKFVPGRIVGTDKRGRPIMRWANQTDSGQNRLGPSPDRWKLRSRTYEGIAEAMAEQWGGAHG